LIAYLVGKILGGDWSLEGVRRLGAAGPLNGAFDGLELAPWSRRPPEDVIDFQAVCQNGQFYSEMAKAWGIPSITRRERNKVKRRCFKYLLFGPVRHRHPAWLALERRWLDVANVLADLKREDHGTAARACQRLESRLMIDGVVENLRVDNEGLPIITIHDSV